jgi:hypothetical protein
MVIWIATDIEVFTLSIDYYLSNMKVCQGRFANMKEIWAMFNTIGTPVLVKCEGENPKAE